MTTQPHFMPDPMNDRDAEAMLATKRDCPHCGATSIGDKANGIGWAVGSEHEPDCPAAETGQSVGAAD